MQMVMERLHGGGGPPPGGPGPSDPGYGPGPPPGPGDHPQQAGAPDPLMAVKSSIQDVHSLIATLPDPTHTQLATQALQALLKIQRDLMGTHQSAQSQGVTA